MDAAGLIGFDSTVLKYRDSMGTHGNLKDIDNLPASGFYTIHGGSGIVGTLPPVSNL